ncbi:MAG: DUF433 domain-containing protein [Actinomycetota bacterium]|nr:DUF433 domain-containing protein [Actinomycetota bacterium]
MRFSEPLYSVAEAARFLDLPPSTFATWVRGRGSSQPIVASLDRRRSEAEIPFFGLVEGMVVAGFRRSGVSMQHIRKALTILQHEVGLEHALANRALYTEGARILYHHASMQRDDELLTVVVTGQGVFAPVVEDYLQRIVYAPDDWAERLILPITAEPLVEADPHRAFGQPVFIHGGARMEDVIDRFRAGEPMAEVAKDFNLRVEDVEAVIRASLAPAA